LEVRLILEVPDSLVFPDGTSAQVKGIAAKVIDGKLEQIVYTVERASGAWTDITSEEVAGADAGDADPTDRQLQVQQV
jgi:hypothetical protein